jgi:lia operon protein LiaG
MKTMKIALILVLSFFCTGILSSQEFKIPFQNSKDGKLILKNFIGTLPIEGYSGNDIIITSVSPAETFKPPEKAKGLKPIYPSGTDNTGIGLDAQKEGNQVTVTCLLPITKEGEYKIKMPDNLALEMESGCERSNEVTVENMKNEIDINNCHAIVLKNVMGPLVLHTISGNIDVTFSTINSGKPFSVTSVSGDIDITLPVKTPTNLDLKTISGSIYSDFDIAETQKNLKRIGGSEFDIPLNGGGFKFSIYSVSGIIYLRKGN